MNNIPLMLRTSTGHSNQEYLLPLQCITLVYDDDNKFIEYALDLQNDPIDKFISADGNSVLIESLHASSYEDFLVQLDLHNLLYGSNLTVNVNTDANALKQEIASLKKENIMVKRENLRLKKKLDEVKSVLK